MAGLRNASRRNYTTIANDVFRDYGLSLKATGLLCKMLALPPDWNFSVQGLTALCSDGKSAVQSALKELEVNGYLIRVQKHRATGTFDSVEYVIYDNKEDREEVLAELISEGYTLVGNLKLQSACIPSLIEESEHQTSLPAETHEAHNAKPQVSTGGGFSAGGKTAGGSTAGGKSTTIKYLINKGSSESLVFESSSPSTSNSNPVSDPEPASIPAFDSGSVSEVASEFAVEPTPASASVSETDPISVPTPTPVFASDPNPVLDPASNPVFDSDPIPDPEPAEPTCLAPELRGESADVDAKANTDTEVDDVFNGLCISAVNRNKLRGADGLAETRKAYDTLLAQGYAADEIERAWSETQEEANRNNRRADMYPQLCAWLRSTTANGQKLVGAAERIRLARRNNVSSTPHLAKPSTHKVLTIELLAETDRHFWLLRNEYLCLKREVEACEATELTQGKLAQLERAKGKMDEYFAAACERDVRKVG